MPVIVVGADSPLGVEIVAALLPNAAEVRAFVSDATVAASLKERGVKVAVGDVSDGSHVGGAALNTFCAVLLPAAALDERERSFAASPAEVVAAWADGLRDAGTTRIIWVDDASTDPGPLRTVAAEFVSVAGVGRSEAETIAEIVELEAAATLGGAT